MPRHASRNELGYGGLRVSFGLIESKRLALQLRQMARTGTRHAGTVVADSLPMSLPTAEPLPARAYLRSVRRPLRIVVAEDDDEMRRVLVQSLRHDGYQVEEAEDGDDLLARLMLPESDAGEPFDLIVSDVRMPGIGGIDLLETFRSTEDATPVILMTAFADDVTRLRAEQLGAMLFDKPFDIDELRIAAAALLIADAS